MTIRNNLRTLTKNSMLTTSMGIKQSKMALVSTLCSMFLDQYEQKQFIMHQYKNLINSSTDHQAVIHPESNNKISSLGIYNLILYFL